MKNYYFTFGSRHKTHDGKYMANCWVRVIAKDFWTARQIFVEKFESKNLTRLNPDYAAFSSQYTDENFEPEYFPEGEYLVVN